MIETRRRGRQVITDPILNKGSAFTQEERDNLNLRGLIPPEEESLEIQLKRSHSAFLKITTPLEKHIFLRTLQDTNETLFYALLGNYIKEMLPIVYAPVVGEACQHFHHIYRKPRGLFLSYPERDKMDAIFTNLEKEHIQVIVVSDGERILGLGDQGICGMGIPIGKITLYTACGGIDPAHGLPVILDTGTDNETLLQDPLYFGWRHKRVRGAEYEAFVEDFVLAVGRHFPNALLQWEDFAIDHAHFLLERYRNRLCTFNDDIQGTAAVTLAGLLAAVKVKGERISDQRIALLGAGSAGTGIAHQIVLAMEQDGLSEEEARSRLYLFDRKGLQTDASIHLRSFQSPFKQSSAPFKEGFIGLKEIMPIVKPTILIGVSASFGAFNEEIIREMTKYTKRPIIFPLSNPPSKCEADPKDLVEWTDGEALIATGTKYPDVIWKGKTHFIGQCNNHYIFPAMGLAVVAAEAHRVTDGMFMAAALTLSDMSPALRDQNDSLFPHPEDIQETAKKIAYAVSLQAIKEGVATTTLSKEALKKHINESFWKPVYQKVLPR